MFITILSVILVHLLLAVLWYEIHVWNYERKTKYIPGKRPIPLIGYMSFLKVKNANGKPDILIYLRYVFELCTSLDLSQFM